MASSNKKTAIRVLHVDDDPSLLEMSKLMLLDMDSSFEIDNACCVDEAFKKLAIGNYDVVVSDYEMPQKDGLKFLKQLREQKNEIPFILFTGKGREEVAVQALNLGADGYINKQGNPETVYGELAHDIAQLVNQNCLKTDLAESEVRFKQFFSNLPNAVAVYEAISNGEDFVFKDFNAAAEKIEKTSKATVIGKRVTEIFPGAKDFGILEIFKRVWKTGQSEYFPATLYQDKRDIGSWHENWLFKLPNGNVVAVYNDVTERVKNDLALKRVNELIERVGEGVDAGLAVIRKDYHVVWANKRLMDLGVAPNKKCYQTFNRSETVCVDCGVKKVFEQNISLDLHEYKTKNSKGEPVWIELRATPLKDTDGNVIAALELAIPITERKKAEDELSDKEKRFRAIFDKSFQFALILDINGNVLEMNELCYTVHGPLAEGCVGKSFWEVAWWSQFPEVVEKTKLAIQSCQAGKNVRDEVRFKDKDSQIHHGIRIFSPIADENGKLLYISVVGLDISERKKAEEHQKVLERKIAEYSKHLKCMVDLRTAQLKDANERLVKSERLAAIGELAGMVGHDLRNPLAGIKNATYYLKKKGTAISEAQTKVMLETIEKALEHSDKIINDLLDYAKEMNLELTKHSAHNLVDEAIGLIQVPTRIQIINHVDEKTWIWVNAEKMIRVFINLIKNAIDAMPQNGTLKISSCQTKDYVAISVVDTGTGIPEETLKKLFTPLFTTKAQGMGFGLAICKRITEAHEGTITVETAVNKGTTFTITLPLKHKAKTDAIKHA